MIGQVFDMQKQFGKSPDQIEGMVRGFCWVLKDYPVDAVIEGVGQYLKFNADMPSPSDIVKIIDPQPTPWKPDKAYYVSLKKIFAEQGPYGLDADEIEYIRRYEEFMRNELRSAS
ncbi:MAG: hypothetical protein WAL34_03905 [Acidobacteriaceae bacterium]